MVAREINHLRCEKTEPWQTVNLRLSGWCVPVRSLRHTRGPQKEYPRTLSSTSPASTTKCLVDHLVAFTSAAIRFIGTAWWELHLKTCNMCCRDAHNAGVQAVRCHHMAILGFLSDFHPSTFLPLSRGRVGVVAGVAGCSRRPSHHQRFPAPPGSNDSSPKMIYLIYIFRRKKKNIITIIIN